MRMVTSQRKRKRTHLNGIRCRISQSLYTSTDTQTSIYICKYFLRCQPNKHICYTTFSHRTQKLWIMFVFFSVFSSLDVCVCKAFKHSIKKKAKQRWNFSTYRHDVWLEYIIRNDQQMLIYIRIVWLFALWRCCSNIYSLLYKM